MAYVAYSFDPRKQEAQLEDYETERYSRFLSPSAQAAAWQREDGAEEQTRTAYNILTDTTRRRA